ncbi:MAG TPA: site-2 protease family protein [Actinomycetota bacterium]|nr:site-2 protease family protein [Actinomycetota bacterium]
MSETVRFALYLAIAVIPSMVLHEYAHALTATRLGDPTPKRWGRLTLSPRPHIDPFGSLILPGLAVILVASGNGLAIVPIFAYAKPMPLDPSYLQNRSRHPVWVILAGLLANLAIAVVAGLAMRVGVSGDVLLFAYAVLLVNVFMFVIQLMPVPGLDGAKLLMRVLPPKPREVYANLEQYLVLFVLVLFFVFAGPFQAIVEALAGTVCRVVAGSDIC